MGKRHRELVRAIGHGAPNPHSEEVRQRINALNRELPNPLILEGGRIPAWLFPALLAEQKAASARRPHHRSRLARP